MFEITMKICKVAGTIRKMMITCTILRGGGGGQRVMIEIIIRVNNENDGRPLIYEQYMHTFGSHSMCIFLPFRHPKMKML